LDGLALFHRNWVGLFEGFTECYPAARCWTEADGITIGISGIEVAAFNGALIFNERLLTPRRLTQLTNLLADEHVPFSIQVCSREPTPTCDALLRSRGYNELFKDPVMIREGTLPDTGSLRAAPTRGLNPLPTHADGQTNGSQPISMHLVDSAEDQATVRDIITEGFQLPPMIPPEFFDDWRGIRGCFQVIACINAQPVGSGMLLCRNGTAGVYNVVTIPLARQQGVGTAIMRYLHGRALKDGFEATVLTSSEMGLPLYRRLGYRRDGYQTGYTLLAIEG